MVRSGSALTVTLSCCVPPSATVKSPWANVTVTAGSSSSPISRVVWVLAPAVTRAGRLEPNPSLTLSSSSSTSSVVAVKARVFTTWPALKVRLDGTS